MLPFELITTIVSLNLCEPNILSREPRRLITPNSIRRHTLLSWSLISRSYRGWAQDRLFESVIFKSNGDVKIFSECMERLGERGDELRARVRRAKVGRMAESYLPFWSTGSLLAACANMESLWCTRTSVREEELNMGTNLRRLYLQSSHLESFTFTNLYLPNLEYLSIGPSVLLTTPSLSTLLSSSTLPSLHSLTFNSFGHQNPTTGRTEYLPKPLPIFSQLTSLSLGAGYLCLPPHSTENEFYTRNEQLRLLDTNIRFLSSTSVPLNHLSTIHIPPHLHTLRLWGTFFPTTSNIRPYSPIQHVRRIHEIILHSLREPLEELITVRSLYEVCPEAWREMEGNGVRKVRMEMDREVKMDSQVHYLREYDANGAYEEVAERVRRTAGIVA